MLVKKKGYRSRKMRISVKKKEDVSLEKKRILVNTKIPYLSRKKDIGQEKRGYWSKKR